MRITKENMAGAAVLSLVVLLGSCAPADAKADALAVWQGVSAVQDITEWVHQPAKDRVYTDSEAAQAAYAVQRQFYDVDTYKGRTCTLTVYVADDLRADSAMVKTGDPALCEATVAAVKAVPAFPARGGVEITVAP